MSAAVLESLLDDTLARRGARYAGLAVAAFGDEGTAFRSLGRATDGPEAPSPDTVFQIGSVTKVFTALLLADAVARGETRFDEPLSTYLPGVASVPGGVGITLGQLASHTAGLPRLPPGLLREGLRHREDPYRHLDDEAMQAALARTRLRSEPGRRVRYSNFGAGLLGAALATLAGTTYADLVATRVVGPLRLRDTVAEPRPDQAGRRATGHARRGRPTPDWDLAALAGAGALYSTVDDLVVLLRAHLDPPEGPLGDALREVQEPRARVSRLLQVALGWHLTPLHRTRHTVLWHNGGTGGFASYVGLLPQARAGVVVLANSARPVDPVGQTIVHRIATSAS